MASPAAGGDDEGDEWQVARKRPSAAAKHSARHAETHRNGATLCGTALVAALLPNGRAALTVVNTCRDQQGAKAKTKLVARLLSEYDTLRLWDYVKFHAANTTVVFIEKLHSSVVYRGVGRVSQLDAMHGRYGYVEVAHIGPVKGPMKRSTSELFFHVESLVPHFSDVSDALRKGELVAFDAVDNDSGIAHATRSKYRGVRLVSLSDCVQHADTAGASALGDDERAWLRTVAGLRHLAEDTPSVSDGDSGAAAADDLSSGVAHVRLDEVDDVCMEDVRSVTGAGTPVDEHRPPAPTAPPPPFEPATVRLSVPPPAPPTYGDAGMGGIVAAGHAAHADVVEMAASGGRVSVTDFGSGPAAAGVSDESVYDAMRLMASLMVEDIRRFHDAPEPYAEHTNEISSASHAALGMAKADCAPCRQRQPTLLDM